MLRFLSSETCSTAVKVIIRILYYPSIYPLVYIIYFVHFCVLGFSVFSMSGCNFPPCLLVLFLSLPVGGRTRSCCVLSSLDRCLCFLDVSMYIMFGHPRFLLSNMKSCVITTESTPIQPLVLSVRTTQRTINCGKSFVFVVIYMLNYL